MHDVWLEYVSGRLGIHPAYDIFRLGYPLLFFWICLGELSIFLDGGDASEGLKVGYATITISLWFYTFTQGLF